MDQSIQERLSTFEQEGLASAEVVAFVRQILLWLEQTSGYSCTEETAGMLASHLMLALERVRRGEKLEELWDASVHEEAMLFAFLQNWSTSIQMQAEQALHLSLPLEELDFLVLHLAAFLAHYDDPRLTHLSRETN